MAKLPESIGKYKVEALIAKGGMGAVYKAIHPTLHRPVIIKKLTLRGRKDINERFKREARILMDFRHDGVVDMYDHFKLGSSYYIVLEFVDGSSLEDVIKRQRYLDNGTAAYILYYTAIALHYAHEKKVVHRDIKPANLLLSKAGDIKLVDFGIAVSDEDADEGLTREGMTLGTPSYMAPEQFQNTKNVDRRADIYSLGVLAYEMLTGKKPFPGGFSSELMNSIQKGKYPNPRKFNPGIHSVLLRFIRKSMKPNTERRYKSLVPVIEELERFLKGYEKEVLTSIVADLAAGKEPEKPKYKIKRGSFIKNLILSVVVIAISLIGIFDYLTGYHNVIFHGDSYGSVIFLARTPVGSQPWYKIFIKADIFQDDDNLIPNVTDKRIIFIKVREDGGDGSYLFRSLPVYLPEGLYRAKVGIEDELTWHSFVVLSRQQQKQNPKTSNGRIIVSGEFLEKPSSLSTKIEVTDILTGDLIETGVSISILYKGVWIDLAESEDLITGGVHKFRIRHDEYNTKIFSLLIRENQDALIIKAGLVPLSGIDSLK
jgi:serine/threonine-protein kinase